MPLDPKTRMAHWLVSAFIHLLILQMFIEHLVSVGCCAGIRATTVREPPLSPSLHAQGAGTETSSGIKQVNETCYEENEQDGRSCFRQESSPQWDVLGLGWNEEARSRGL